MPGVLQIHIGDQHAKAARRLGLSIVAIGILLAGERRWRPFAGRTRTRHGDPG